MKVYQARYCDWVESYTISVHLTKKGAKEALKQDKKKQRAEYDKLKALAGSGIGRYSLSEKNWFILETEVLP